MDYKNDHKKNHYGFAALALVAGVGIGAYFNNGSANTSAIKLGEDIPDADIPEMVLERGQLVNKVSEMCLYEVNGGQWNGYMKTKACDEIDEQIWELMLNGQLRNVATGRCANPPGQDGRGEVWGGACTEDHLDQKWSLGYFDDDGNFRFVNMASGNCLNVMGGDYGNGQINTW